MFIILPSSLFLPQGLSYSIFHVFVIHLHILYKTEKVEHIIDFSFLYTVYNSSQLKLNHDKYKYDWIFEASIISFYTVGDIDTVGNYIFFYWPSLQCCFFGLKKVNICFVLWIRILVFRTIVYFYVFSTNLSLFCICLFTSVNFKNFKNDIILQLLFIQMGKK